MLAPKGLKNCLILSRYHVCSMAATAVAWISTAAGGSTEMTGGTVLLTAADVARLIRNLVFTELISRRLLREVADARGSSVGE